MVTNPWHGQFVDVDPGSRSSYGPLWVVMAVLDYSVFSVTFGLHVLGSIRGSRPCDSLAVPLSGCGHRDSSRVEPDLCAGSRASCLRPDRSRLRVELHTVLLAVERRDLFVLERVSLPGLLGADVDAVIIASADMRVLFANDVAKKLFADGQLEPGKALDTLLADVAPSFSIARSAGVPHRQSKQEHRFRDRSGNELWINVDISPVHRGRGALAGICLRLRDCTPLRYANEELAERTSVLEAVIRGSGEGLLVQSASGDIRYANEAFAKLWDVSLCSVRERAEELPERVGALLRERPTRRLESAWHRRAEDFDELFEHIEDLLLADGRIIEVQTFPIDPQEGVDGRVWCFADVTRRRQDAQAMIHSQKLEGLGVLAGGIAHDFNNLLVAILANAELAREAVPEGAVASRLIGDVESAAVRASELTGQLLAYAGKASFEREEVNLTSLVQDVVELLTVSIPKGIELDFHLSKKLARVRAGTSEIRQIVMNLVTNAADSIAEDGGTIRIETGQGRPGSMPVVEVRAEHGEIPKSAAYLRIVDSGTGMDRRTLERIFDPFFTTKFTGRGLGLAATLGILDSHGGALEIETALGVGSAFTVFLPIHDVHREAGSARSGEVRAVRFEECSVLVVDDEPSVRSVLSKVLSGAGLDVVEANCGEDALAVLKATGKPRTS